VIILKIWFPNIRAILTIKKIFHKIYLKNYILARLCIKIKRNEKKETRFEKRIY
jgi:hypothetical protein